MVSESFEHESAGGRVGVSAEEVVAAGLVAKLAVVTMCQRPVMECLTVPSARRTGDGASGSGEGDVVSGGGVIAASVRALSSQLEPWRV